MTIPVVPGPFSFIGQLGQAAGEAGQQAIAEKSRNFERGHLIAGLITNLVAQKQLKPEALAGPEFAHSLDLMGIPTTTDSIGKNVVPRPSDVLDTQRSSLLKEYFSGLPGAGITPEQQSHLAETGVLAGPEDIAAGKATALATAATGKQQQAVTEATTPAAPVLAQAGQAGQFASLGVARGSRYVAQAMAEAPKIDRFGVAVLTPQHIQRAMQLAQQAGDASVTPDLIAAAAEDKRKELSNESAKMITAWGMLARGENTGAAANSPDRVLNNSLQRVTGQLGVNRQRMGDIEKQIGLTTAGMKIRGLDPTPLTPEDLANPLVQEYQRLQGQSELLENNFNDLQSVMGTAGLQKNAPAATTAGVTPPVAKTKPNQKPSLTPLTAADLQRAKADPKFKSWLQSKGYTVP